MHEHAHTRTHTHMHMHGHTNCWEKKAHNTNEIVLMQFTLSTDSYAGLAASIYKSYMYIYINMKPNVE